MSPATPAFLAPLPLGTSGTLLARTQKCRVRGARTRAAHVAVRASQTPPEKQPEKRPEKPAAARAAEARGETVGYWQGEWICVDCGFVYKPGRRVKFEDLPGSWKCPQCNAPKRRFAKKAGDFIKETSGTSNAPIIVFSVVGLVATVLFGIWASANL